MKSNCVKFRLHDPWLFACHLLNKTRQTWTQLIRARHGENISRGRSSACTRVFPVPCKTSRHPIICHLTLSNHIFDVDVPISIRCVTQSGHWTRGRKKMQISVAWVLHSVNPTPGVWSSGTKLGPKTKPLQPYQSKGNCSIKDDVWPQIFWRNCTGRNNPKLGRCELLGRTHEG